MLISGGRIRVRHGDLYSTKNPSASVFDGRNIGKPDREIRSSLQHKHSFIFSFLTEASQEMIFLGDLSHNPLVTLGLSVRPRCGAVRILQSFAQPSRHFGASQIALIVGVAHVGIARATVWHIWACQVAIVVVRGWFCYPQKSCAEILARRSCVESWHRDLDLAMEEASDRDFVQRRCIEICSDLAKKSVLANKAVIKILYEQRDLLQRSCTETWWREGRSRSKMS